MALTRCTVVWNHHNCLVSRCDCYSKRTPWGWSWGTVVCTVSNPYRALVRCPAAPLLVPANVPGKAARDSMNTQLPANLVRDQVRFLALILNLAFIPSSWWAFGGMNQWLNDLSPFLLLYFSILSSIKKKKEEKNYETQFLLVIWFPLCSIPSPWQ